MLKPISILTLMSIIAFITGCSQVNMYPICFYKNKPDPNQLSQRYISAISQSFSSVTGGKSTDVIISPDVRWIVSNTTKSQDERLLKMWPRLACIGPAGSTSEVKLQADCIAYVKDFIINKEYTQTGKYKGVSDSYYNESRDKDRLVYCAKYE